MDIGWFRDLAVIILGVVAAVVLIFVAVLSFLFYRRMRSILDSLKTTSRTIEWFSSFRGEGVAKPVIQAAAVIQGIRHGIDSISKLFGKKGGGDG